MATSGRKNYLLKLLMINIPKKSQEYNTVQVGVVGIIIDEDGKILLVKRRGKSHEGMWGLPAGTMQPGETVKEALEREMREELGIEIIIKRFIGHYYDAHLRDARYATAVDLPHICFIKKGVPQPLQEGSEVRWFKSEEFDNQCLPYDQRQMIIDAGLI